MKNKINRRKIIGNSLNKIKTLFLLIIFLSFSSTVLAIEVDAGEDKTGCPGEEIEIGGEPTAGPGAPDSYKYTWRSDDGTIVGTTANPTITVPKYETFYTVEVEDADGFVCEDFMIVTPVEIEDISFSEPSLPADGVSTATASAVIIPADRTVKWSIEGDKKGCTIDEITGLITAGEESGYITVRASDSESLEKGLECYEEAEYCIGNECCEDIEVERTFGPITVKFNTKIKAKGQDEDGWCEYAVNGAKIDLIMKGLFPEDYNYNLKEVTVSWKEKRTESSYDFKEVSITWNGKEATRTFGVIQANLTQIGLTVSSGGALSGTTTFTVNQVNDVKMGGVAVLKKGSKGTFTYLYTSSENFEGNWKFGGISGLNIILQKGSSEIGTLTGNMDDEGNLNGKFKANTPGNFSTKAGFKAQLTQLDLDVTWNITENEFTFNSGTGSVKVYDIKDVKGEIQLELTFSSKSVTTTSTLKDVTAFGCEITGEISAEFSFDFEINSITGKNISAKHAKFDQEFKNVGFEIKSGSLEKFSIGEIKVKYNNKYFFKMAKASYDKKKGLIFNAKMEIGTLVCDITKFAIDSEGNVAIGNIKIDFEQSPVEIHANFAYKESEFKGNFSGKFKGGIGIEGAVVVGAQADYNYCYFALALEGGKVGVPLGPSGLKVNKLGGEFGYNWSPGSDFATISGSPQKGTMVIGFLLGIGDVADIVDIEGHVRLTLGAADAIDLAGAVKVTASSPHYLTGQAQIHYVLGTYEVNGSLSSTVKIPPSTGKILSLNSGEINFGVANEEWYVSAGGLNGKIFDAIEVNTGLEMKAPLSNIGGMTGSLFGSLTYDNTFAYAYPEEFNPTTCETADATDNLVGFGIKGELNLHLGGALNASLNKDGIVGSISVDASAAGNLSIKWPCLITCGDNCVSQFAGAASGELSVGYDGDKTRIHGELMFKEGDEEEKAEIDFEI